MRTLVLVFAALALPACPAAAQPSSAAPSQPRSLYAVSAAGLGSAMSYCIARHGRMRQGSEAERCYARARAILGAAGLRDRAAQVDTRCADPATFNECITPEIGRLVYDLNDRFIEEGL
ncbi:hypothetical protein [Luteimonas huabeiensis]|uniref:hypothetical protein n=1 Tax=Luteimonas huabeiensis TaxID=1244513 RepID=UPI00046629CF|nr:hypothetical protein [Luteimonas huabeiensis]